MTKTHKDSESYHLTISGTSRLILNATVPPKHFCIIKWEEVVATMMLQDLQEPKPVKQCESNVREREWDGEKIVA